MISDVGGGSPDRDRPTVLLPFAVDELGTLPTGLVVAEWDGTGALLDTAEGIELYVQPYMIGDVAVRAMTSMPRLRVVQTLTAGVDHVIDEVPAGVTLCNARGVHDASTAELAVGLMIAAQRNLDGFARAQTEGRWASERRPALADQRVVVVGHGSIGAALERRLEGFEVDLVRVASRPRDGVHGPAALPELLPEADIVVLLVPLTDQTRGLVDADFLARMRDGALLVNVARGAVVDTAALVQATGSGRIRAALDVTDPEPLPPDHPLWRTPGVIITPHVGGATSAMRPRVMRLVADQLRRFAANEPLGNVVVQGDRYPRGRGEDPGLTP